MHFWSGARGAACALRETCCRGGPLNFPSCSSCSQCCRHVHALPVSSMVQVHSLNFRQGRYGLDAVCIANAANASGCGTMSLPSCRKGRRLGLSFLPRALGPPDPEPPRLPAFRMVSLLCSAAPWAAAWPGTLFTAYARYCA